MVCEISSKANQPVCVLYASLCTERREENMMLFNIEKLEVIPSWAQASLGLSAFPWSFSLPLVFQPTWQVRKEHAVSFGLFA